MYVCVCNAVTDSEIRQCADAGARTLGDLRERLGIATSCGKCAQSARGLLRAHRSQECTAQRMELAVVP